MVSENDIMEVADAAALLGVHIQTLRKLARKKKIPAFKLGRDWRFRREALVRWADEQQLGFEPTTVPNTDDKADESANPQRPVVHNGLVLTGRSILPPESSPTGLTGVMILEVALDSAAHRVVTVVCEGLPKLGQKVLTGLLVGKSLPEALHATKERLSSRYYFELREPVNDALEEIRRKYGELARQVTHVDMEDTCSVLIVDDGEKICQAMCRTVKELECSTRSATGEAEGLDLVASEVPDLILLDLVMPEMNGIQFLELLRKAPPDLPVVIVTGYPDSELIRQATQHAPVLHLAKPIEPALLERTVRNVMGDKMSMRSAE